MRNRDMWREHLFARRCTDNLVTILMAIPGRMTARSHPYADEDTMVMFALWSLLRWERKLGLAALETMGADVPALTSDLDALLRQKNMENPVAKGPEGLVFAKTGLPVPVVDEQALLEPLVDQAERESRAMGDKWVGSEHLLLAIIEVADIELSTLLLKHSVTGEKAQEAIAKLLEG